MIDPTADQKTDYWPYREHHWDGDDDADISDEWVKLVVIFQTFKFNPARSSTEVVVTIEVTTRK